MHTGLGFFFQGLDDAVSDTDVWTTQLKIADRAEAAGFESLWTPEHHFTRYHMMPNPLQFLTWAAGRTQRALLGTMVMILPWHDPIRVAEEVAVLDIISGGRAILGLGRGLGKVEFDGFNLNMGESRQRFVEYATALSDSLETGIIKSDGGLYKQQPVAVRPLQKMSFRGRTYASAVSPESARIMAKFGYGLLLIAQKPWDTVIAETKTYSALFEEINGYPAPRPLLVNLSTVDTDAGYAQSLHDEYTMAYARSTVDHYEFVNPQMESIEGYEYYGGLRRNIVKHGVPAFNGFLAGLQIGGTPDRFVEDLTERVRALDCGGVIHMLNMGGMPPAVAERNFNMFSEHVMPKLKAIDTFRQIPSPALDAAFNRNFSMVV
ncbi:LLM class flavin-dependent oxidoreductase [Sphingobium sp.]|uniref:LLM class flavin-dependent oxidoreductase n=1 Tax=Sphingobium sp. TaxID=1912891 RepID=UPI003B3AB3DE